MIQDCITCYIPIWHKGSLRGDGTSKIGLILVSKILVISLNITLHNAIGWNFSTLVAPLV